MRLSAQQIEQFKTDGWLFLPEAFDAEETALLRSGGRGHYASSARRSGARRTARHASPLPRTPTASPFACWARIRA